jgi:hypothetical protein
MKKELVLWGVRPSGGYLTSVGQPGKIASFLAFEAISDFGPPEFKTEGQSRVALKVGDGRLRPSPGGDPWIQVVSKVLHLIRLAGMIPGATPRWTSGQAGPPSVLEPE